ncbi:MAG: amino acid adenylation domain-containing protein [Crocosphaera sp.]|nr:amino acid adenylation domain-containing protein [Crocosphaera sp.]
MVNTVKNLEKINYQHQIDNLTNTNVKYAPLSFAQERIWFLEQLEPNSTAYNMLEPFRLEGNLNITALEQSINAIINRHDSFRTRFILEGENPVQVVIPKLSITLPLVDLSHLSQQEQQKTIEQIVRETVEQKFDLEVAPLLRVTLLRLSSQVHQLLVTTHHIVMDGWSYDVFIKDLEQFYRAFITDESPGLSQLPLQYPNYAKSQKNNFVEDALNSKLAYWKENLQGNLPLLQLPLDYPRQPERTSASGREGFHLDASLTEKLKALSRHEGVTLYMTLLATVNTLLYRYSHQEDIIVGTPIAGRNEKKTRDLIGCFINTLALRSDLSGNPTFKELLKRVRQVALGAFRHLDTPFEKLVETLKPERQLNISPIFQVLFSFQNTPSPQLSLPELTITSLDIQRGTAMLDLIVEIKETPSGLTIWFDYDRQLFTSATIQGMLNHFKVLLKGIIDNPQQNIGYLPLLTEAEQQQILIKWNQTLRNYPQSKCIHQLFEEQVEKTPNAVAVVFEEQELTYKELNDQANQLGHHLRELGIKPENLVGICVERSLELVVAILGTLKAGGAYVPLEPTYPLDRLDNIIKTSEMSVVIADELNQSKISSLGIVPIPLDPRKEPITSQSPKNLELLVSPEQLAYVIYTSGSTGTPKGVMIEHKSVVNLSEQLEKTIYLGEEKLRIGLNGTFAFDTSVKQIIQLLKGHTLAIIPQEIRLDEKELLSFLSTHHIDSIDCTPSQLETWLEAGLLDLSHSPRSILVGGENIGQKTWKILSEAEQIQFFNLYGPTECTVDATICPIKNYPEQPILGYPLGNVRVYLLDQFLQPVPMGVAGEIHIGGVGLARGYLNRKELTEEKFITNPFGPGRLYKTGDLGKYLHNGTIQYLGRIDHQVKIRGFRIELGEIEAVLTAHPPIREAIVITLENQKGNKRLVAYLVGENLSNQELRSYLEHKLPDYMIPNTFIWLEKMPLTANGKIDRRGLPIPDLSRNESLETLVTPRNDIEGQLVAIWEDILGVQPIGIQDNFFELGGHSLISVRLFSQIEQTFSVKLPLSTLFKAPTIRQLAQELQEMTKGKIWESLVMIRPGISNQPAVFIVHDGDGETILYHTLAHHLHSDHRVYGLRPNGKVGCPLLQTTIKAIASHYIDQIRTVQPQGPYLLGGFCLGGNIAFEMAEQLQRQGEEIALLFLIDSLEIQARGGEAVTNQARRQRLGQLFSQTEQKGALQKFAYLGEQLSRKLRNFIIYQSQQSLKQVINKVRIPLYRHYIDKNWDLPAFLQNISIRELLDFDITRNYFPPHYQGQVVLFSSTEVIISDHPTINDTPVRYLSKDPDALGWQKWVKEDMTIYDVPGGHSSMLQEPYVDVLAEKLQNSINQALS